MFWQKTHNTKLYGNQSYPSVAMRDAHPRYARTEKTQTFYVQDTDTTYHLVGGIDNEHWQVYNPGGYPGEKEYAEVIPSANITLAISESVTIAKRKSTFGAGSPDNATVQFSGMKPGDIISYHIYNNKLNSISVTLPAGSRISGLNPVAIAPNSAYAFSVVSDGTGITITYTPLTTT